MSLWLFIIVSSPFLQNSEAVSVFEKGAVKSTYYQLDQLDIAHTSPPKPLLIVTPTVNGTYPVVLFLHGTCLLNSYYTNLLQHISSHGYIIVAPQLYSCLNGVIPMLPISGPSELEYAAQIANWLPSGLETVLPQNVIGDLEKLCVGGHSRGGKIAYALALGYADTSLAVKISALVGLDPVEGTSENSPILPKVLAYEPDSLNLTIPVVVIGTGLGNEPVCWLVCPACAPNGMNHDNFFDESKAPAAHFVTSDYGHMDMLNDNINDVVGKLTVSLCKSSEDPNKDPMRKSVGGITVAFLDAYFEGKIGEYMNIVKQPSLAPAKLQPVHFKPSYANLLIIY
ncbi:chlorophyllase 1 [Euphorbia peplus]|nr:chlorophyllase 1 [Euphorbia peplus]